MRTSFNEAGGKWRRVCASLGALVFGSSLAIVATDLLAAIPPVAAATTTFAPSADCQVYTVPANVTQVRIEALGGSGFFGSGPGSIGGRGGLVSATLEVESGTPLSVIVGSNGGASGGAESQPGGSARHGGLGGRSGKASRQELGTYYGGGGGGASFVSADGGHCDTSGAAINGDAVLAVAGGGGGGGAESISGDHGGDGGDAGQDGGQAEERCFLGGCDAGALGGASGSNGGGGADNDVFNPGLALTAPPRGSTPTWTYFNGGGAHVPVSSNTAGGGGGGWVGGAKGSTVSEQGGGGGGGSNYLKPGASATSIGVGTYRATPYVTITDLATRRLTVAHSGTGSGTVTTSDGGINCGATCKAFYSTGTTVTLIATPTPGSRFAGWTGGGCFGTGACQVAMTVARDVTATFNTLRRITFTDDSFAGSGTVTASPGGFPCGSGCTFFDQGTTVTFTAVPSATSAFRGWSGACDSLELQCVLTFTDSDRTLRYRFDDNVLTVANFGDGSVTSSPPGIDCGVDCENFYPWGTEVELTAHPDPNRTFQWHYGSCVNTGLVCRVTMEGSRRVNAAFLTIPHLLSVSKTTLPSGLPTGSGRITSSPDGIDCDSACPFSNVNFDQGTTITLTATPTSGTPSSDSTFNGWSGACTNATGPCLVSMTDAKSVVANFVYIPMHRLLVLRGGNGTGTVTSGVGDINCGSVCEDDIYLNTPVTLTANPGPNSTFESWSGGGCSGSALTCTTTITAATTVRPRFALVKHQLTIAKAGTGTGTATVTFSKPGDPDETVNLDCGAACTGDFEHGDVVLVTAANAGNSLFTSWTGCTTTTGTNCTVTMDQARTVTVNFTRNVRRLDVSKSGGGTGTVTSDLAAVGGGAINCGTVCSGDFDRFATVVLTATPTTADSYFAGWSGECNSTSETCAVGLADAASVGARFELNTLTVVKTGGGSGRVTSSPPGVDCTTTCSRQFPLGTPVVLTATADSGSTFTGWSGACTTATGSCTVTLSGPNSVTATFATTPAVTVVIAGSGTRGKVTATEINCGDGAGLCTRTLTPGQSVTLTASAPNGSSTTFDGWSGACTGTSATCTLTPTDAVTVTATFTRHTRNLTVTLGGTGHGRVQSSVVSLIGCPDVCVGAYGIDDTALVQAIADPDSTFEGWEGACSGADANCRLTMTENRAATAIFTAKPRRTLTIAKEIEPGVGTMVGRGTITSDVGGIDCGAVCTGDFYHGQIIRLTTVVGANTRYDGWAPGTPCTATGVAGTCEFQVVADETITARLTLRTAKLTITNHAGASNARGTVTVSPQNLVCVTGICQYDVEDNTSLTLTAAAASDSVFNGWGSSAECTNSDANTTGVCNLDRPSPVTASWVRKPWVLNLAANVGTGAGTVTVTPLSGSATTCTAVCTSSWAVVDQRTLVLTQTPDASSTFLGWTGCKPEADGSCSVRMTENRDVTARFDLKPRRLTMVTTGTGAGDVKSNPAALACQPTCSADFAHGTVVKLRANANQETSELSGWSDPNCIGVIPDCYVTMDAAKTITATFTLIQRALSVNLGGTGTGSVTSSPNGVNCTASCSSDFAHGTSVTLTATPTAATSQFVGWEGACTNASGTCTVALDAAKTVRALFNLIPRQVSVTRVGTGSGSVSSAPAGIDCPTTCATDFAHGTTVTLTAVADVATSSFISWSGCATVDGALCTVEATQTRAVTATFTLLVRDLLVTLTGPGTGSVTATPAGSCSSDCTLPFAHATVVTLTAVADAASSRFAGWDGACTNPTGTCTVTMDQARSLTATFELRGNALSVQRAGSGTGSVTSSPAGVDCGGTCEAEFTHGTPVTLTAAPDDATSRFAGWDGACTNATGSCAVTMDAAKAVSATFELLPRALSVAFAGTGLGRVVSSPTGLDCTTQCTRDFGHGTNVSLTPSPNPGSFFAGWSGACTNAVGACDVAMTAAKTVTATFTQLPVAALTVVPTGTGAGAVTGAPGAISCPTDCSESFDAGTTVTLRAAPADASSVFAGWTGGGCTGIDSCTVTLNNDTTVRAEFKAIVVVTPQPVQISYGNAFPAPLPSYANLTPPDTAPAGVPPCQVVANEDALRNGKPIPGTYPSTCSNAADDRYLFSYAAGTATVVKAPLVIAAVAASRAYGMANPTFLFSGDFVNDDTATAFSTQPTCSSTAAANAPVGNYPIGCSGAASNFYAITYAPATLTVTPAALSVTANPKQRTYGSNNPALDGVLTGVVGGDGITATYATAATPASSVGPYAIVPTLLDPNNRLGNYTVTSTNGVLTIVQRPLSVVANNKSRIYGASNPPLDGTITGALAADTLTATYATDATSVSAVGAYAIVPTLVDPLVKLSNYDVTSTNGTLNVTRRQLVVTPHNKAKEVGAVNPELTGTIVGLASGDVISVVYNTTATEISPAGTYPITATLVDPGGKLGSYDVTLNVGTLTVGRVPTALVAVPLRRTGLRPTAILTRTDTGAPIVGVTVTFWRRDGSRICAGVTDSTGRAVCPRAGIVLRFEARYEGSLAYKPATATGHL